MSAYQGGDRFLTGEETLILILVREMDLHSVGGVSSDPGLSQGVLARYLERYKGRIFDSLMACGVRMLLELFSMS